jgi:hypothetical protein
MEQNNPALARATVEVWEKFFYRSFLEKEQLQAGKGAKWVHLELHSLRRRAKYPPHTVNAGR